MRIAESTRRWLVIAGLALIGSLGLASAVLRSATIVNRLWMHQPSRAVFTPTDSMVVERTIAIARLSPQSTAAGEVMTDLRGGLSKFSAKPWTTLMHVLPAVLFMILAPLQFSRRIRRRYAGFHRWSGRILLIMVPPIAAAGVYFGTVDPLGGPLERIPVAIFGVLFVVCAVRGFVAIRHGDRLAHRAWMTRMIAVALSASVQRAVSLPLVLVTGHGPRVWFTTSVWIGFGVSVVIAESIIRQHPRYQEIPL